MALYRVEAKIVGRQARGTDKKVIPGKTVSSVAKAAYRSGERLRDERIGKTFNYASRSQEVVHSEIVAPSGAPSWMLNRGKLWNAVERVEKRSDSQLAREFLVAMPVELTAKQQEEVIRSWCKDELVSKGFVCDFALHRSKDGRNPHAHVLATLRPVDPESPSGFGKKPDMSGKFNGRGDVGRGAKSDLMRWRESWGRYCNKALEEAGEEARVDHRSLKERGIDREPEPKIGVAAAAMRKRGVENDPWRVRLVRRLRLANSVRSAIRDIEEHGEVTNEPAGGSWWEKAQGAASRIYGHAAELMRDESSGGWRQRVERQQNGPGPIIDRG